MSSIVGNGFVAIGDNNSKILTGATVPSNSIGTNGQLYKRTFPIPSNVNFVEYLQSSGTQYIDTGIKGNQNTDFLIKTKKLAEGYGFFGARTGNWDSCTKALYVQGSSNGKDAIVKTGSTSKSTQNFEFNRIVNSVCNESTQQFMDKNYSIKDNVSLFSFGIENFETDGTLTLFGVRSSSNIGKAPVAVYRCTIFQNNVPIKDYVPCLDSNNIACMFDSVTQEYIYNDGTGDFTYGSTATPDELEPVLYIKKNNEWKILEEDDVSDIST